MGATEARGTRVDMISDREAGAQPSRPLGHRRSLTDVHEKWEANGNF